MFKKNKQKFFVAILFLIFFGLIAFIPKIQNFGYYNDDWWQILGAENFGAVQFPEMYTSDRPARAFWHALLFLLFGIKIFPYQVLAVGIRVLGAIGLFFTLNMVWKRRFYEVSLISLIFLLYPGFLEQPNGFDYQIQQIALTLFIFSIGLSIQSIKAKASSHRIIYLLISSVFSLITFFFMEYYVGLEIYRWLFIGCIFFRDVSKLNLKTIYDYFLKTVPYSIAMVVFMIWRIFFFKSTRYTTDISRIGYDFIQSPFISIINIFRRWLGDIRDVFFTVWVKKGYKNLEDLNTNDFFLALLIGLLAVAIFVVFQKIVLKKDDANKESSIETTLLKLNWHYEAMLVGFIGAVVCLIPINLAGREVSYPIFNRFSFTPSIGVSISVIGFLTYFLKQKWQTFAFSLLIFAAVVSHFSNNTYYANRWKETQNFWQQFAFRVPGMAGGTMLSGYYPETIQEGYFIWAPANLLYAYKSPDILVGAEVLNNETIKAIQMEHTFEKSFRSFYFNFSFADTLIFSKPTVHSCVRFIDKNQIELSIYDHPLISLAAPYSNIEKITNKSTLNHEMLVKVFGPSNQSEETWCYIYEKASLARQFEDWQEVVDLHALARQHELKPYDAIELFPFIQAYAYVGMQDEVNQLVPIINKTDYYRHQACQNFTNMKSSDPQVKLGNQYLTKIFCN